MAVTRTSTVPAARAVPDPEVPDPDASGTDASGTDLLAAGRAVLTEHRAVTDASEALLPIAAAVAGEIIACYRRGGTLFSFGNGGSAADAQHLAAEMVGRFRRERGPLPAVALTVDSSALTSIGNDYGFSEIFSRQLHGLARPGDVAVGFSTSGTSENVVSALAAARRLGVRTVLLTGAVTRPEVADHCLAVPSTTTARIQEMHLVLLHLISELVDSWAADSWAADSAQ